MTETAETIPEVETIPVEEPVQPIRYATFNSRVLAACIDVFIVMTFAIPVTNWILETTMGPIKMEAFSAIANNPALGNDPVQLIKDLVTLAHKQGLFVRAFFENLIQLTMMAAYTLPFWFHYAATPGKMLLRLELHDAQSNEKISRRQAVYRFFAYIVSFIPLSLGFIWIACNKKHRGWHDMLAKTVVVVKQKKRNASK